MSRWFEADKVGLRQISERLVERRGFGILGAERASRAAAEGYVDGCRGCAQRQGTLALAAMDHLREVGIHTAVNTQINRLSMPYLGHVLDTAIAAGGKSWQVQLTVAMGRAADEPDVVSGWKRNHLLL